MSEIDDLKIDIRLNGKVLKLTRELFYLLFEPELSYEKQFKKVEQLFLKVASPFLLQETQDIWSQFAEKIESIKKNVYLDAKATEENDPASNSIEEVILAYPGFYATTIYRISHELYLLNTPIIPRMMSEHAHSYTGTDIHPGAEIGNSFFIDHATGIVIGETVVIKDNVKIYQGVTLGAFHVKKSMSAIKRHPTIEENVIIYANATILGDTIVGKNSVIGGNVWITEPVPPNSFVHHVAETVIKSKK